MNFSNCFLYPYEESQAMDVLGLYADDLSSLVSAYLTVGEACFSRLLSRVASRPQEQKLHIVENAREVIAVVNTFVAFHGLLGRHTVFEKRELEKDDPNLIWRVDDLDARIRERLGDPIKAYNSIISLEAKGAIPRNLTNGLLSLISASEANVSSNCSSNRDRHGFDERGFNPKGYDALGYDADGLDIHGFDSNDFDADGFNRDGFNLQGLTRTGDRYDSKGFDADGFNRDGYDIDGFDVNGFDRNGYDCEGFDADGLDCDGYDRESLDADGLTRDGYTALWEVACDVKFDVHHYVDPYCYMHGRKPDYRDDVIRHLKSEHMFGGVYLVGYIKPDSIDKITWDRTVLRTSDRHPCNYIVDNDATRSAKSRAKNFDRYKAEHCGAKRRAKSGYRESCFDKDGFDAAGFDRMGYHLTEVCLNGFYADGYIPGSDKRTKDLAYERYWKNRRERARRVASGA